MVNVVNDSATEMNVELQGENVDDFLAGIDVDKLECVKKFCNISMSVKNTDILCG